MAVLGSERLARTDTIDDIVCLIRLYGGLSASAKDDLFANAVESFATNVRGAPAREVEEGRALHAWLTALALDTFPRWSPTARNPAGEPISWSGGDEAAELLDIALQVDSSSEEAIFPDGPLLMVLCASEGQGWRGEYLFGNYMHVRATTDGEAKPPDPADYLRVDVSQENFTELEGLDRVFNKDAYNAEIRRKCCEEFASMVGLWRSRFLDALLGGRPSWFAAASDGRHTAPLMLAEIVARGVNVASAITQDSFSGSIELQST